MDFNSVPNRASDAGPEPGPETWKTEVAAAAEEISFAIHYENLDPNRELRQRRLAISDAIDHLRAALDMLPKAVL